MKKVNIENLTSEIMNQLDSYKEVTNKTVKRAVQSAGTSIKKDIKSNAPKNTGKYASGWKTKKLKETDSSLSVVVYTPSGYRLSHLLEFGHAKRNGGRVPAKPHIKPAEERGIKDFEKLIKEGFTDG